MDRKSGVVVQKGLDTHVFNEVTIHLNELPDAINMIPTVLKAKIF